MAPSEPNAVLLIASEVVVVNLDSEVTLDQPRLSENLRRTCTQFAAIIHLETKKSVNSLATVASVAQLVGFFGTAIGFANSFPGFVTAIGISVRRC